MKTLSRLFLTLLAASISLPAIANDQEKEALGSLLGGVTGAVIGQKFYGAEGATVGATLGTAAGTAIVKRRQREFVREQVVTPVAQQYAASNPWAALVYTAAQTAK